MSCCAFPPPSPSPVISHIMCLRVVCLSAYCCLLFGCCVFPPPLPSPRRAPADPPRGSGENAAARRLLYLGRRLSENSRGGGVGLADVASTGHDETIVGSVRLRLEYSFCEGWAGWALAVCAAPRQRPWPWSAGPRRRPSFMPGGGQQGMDTRCTYVDLHSSPTSRERERDLVRV